MTPRSQRKGVALAGLLWSVGAILVLALLAAASIRRIAPDEIGIRIVNLGPGKGLVKQDFDAGFYRNIWLLESWDTLPRSVQRVSFTNRADLRGPDDLPAIEAKTKDGDRIVIEATVLFRILAGKGHVVYQDSGKGDAFKRVARDIAGAEIPAAFAVLGTEKIYDETERRRAYDQLTQSLGTRLANLRNLELVNVAITEVSYDPKYEEQLERKKLADQKKLLENSLTIKATELGKKNATIQETDNKVKGIQNTTQNEVKRLNATNAKAIEVVRAEATRESGRIKSEGTQYRALKDAEGYQAVREADAYAIQRQREALGDHGENYVAYVTAQNFPVKQVIMPSVGIDWLSPLSLARFAGALVEAASPAGDPKKPH